MQYKMYHLTMYNISEIQKGIQSYHAGMEYALKFWKDDNFQSWLKNEKTVIILNGGTSNTMMDYAVWLYDLRINYAEFFELDLNRSLSALAFLVSEQVYDKEKYPSFEINTKLYRYKGDNFLEYVTRKDNGIIRSDIKDLYNTWLISIGGETNRKLRVFLQQFKLV